VQQAGQNIQDIVFIEFIIILRRSVRDIYPMQLSHRTEMVRMGSILGRL
jgi:hypothetical protein